MTGRKALAFVMIAGSLFSVQTFATDWSNGEAPTEMALGEKKGLCRNLTVINCQSAGALKLRAAIVGQQSPMAASMSPTA